MTLNIDMNGTAGTLAKISHIMSGHERTYIGTSQLTAPTGR